MPRRNRAEDLDFEIHVDPSCLSDPMDDNEHKGHEEPKTEEQQQEQNTTNTSNIDIEQEAQLPAGPKAEPAVEAPEEDGKPIVTPVEPEDDNQAPILEPEAEDDTQDKLQQDTEELDQDTPKPAEAESETESSLDDQQQEDYSYISSEDESEEHQAKPAASETKEAATENQEEETHSESESDRSESRRSSASSGSYLSDRRHSDRTEPLIQKAARDIVSQIGSDGKRDSLSSYSGSDETGYFSRSESSSARQSDAHMSVEDGTRGGVDEAGDNSSHHEHEDDVFSDRSPRSSIGSGVSETDNRKTQEAMDRMSKSPRISGISGISGLSEYDREEDEFVPTIRGTPRPAFRSPSSVKAMQMSSPPASVMGSPRSSRRAPLPTVSRVGSPRFSEQYSPKKTPPRFKRSTPPLVLLHVTLLPLRWPWGDVLENADPEDMSQEAKTIRDAWRTLQDRMGDTTVERGILLPHPQNDYEVLEERLLEALELPVRRRARILECGHYLGPSNMSILDDESSSESEEDSDYDDEPDTRRSSRRSQPEKTHWCKTCRSDIRYESLGEGKIFRVKVYASNGLIRGGAWEACWKEMERVDVEIEPLVDAVAQHELVQMEADQERELAMREAEEEERYVRLEEEHREFESRERGRLAKRRGESRSHVGDESHLTEGESHLEESHLQDRSLHAQSRHSHHDESLHDITRDHEESHIADTTEPEKAADTTREPAEDDTKDYTDDLDKSRSFDDLEKDLDEHLQEEHERRSQADESRLSLEPDDVSHMDAQARAAPSSRASISPEDIKDEEEEQKRRDEERFREIYGDAPAQDEHAQRSFPEHAQHHDQQYTERGQPGASDYQGMPPSGETYPQTEDRQKAMKSASLPELLAESARVLMQDKKNILIGLLSVLILLLAIRGGPGPTQDPRTFQTIIKNPEVPTVTVTQEAVVPTAEAIKQATPSAETVMEESSISVELPKESVASEKVEVPEESPIVKEKETVAKENRAAPEESAVEDEPEVVVEKVETSSKSRAASSRSTTASASAQSIDPCASCSRGGRAKDPFRDLVYAPPPRRRRETETETLISERVVRVVETVTAMETATVKVTETATEVVVSRETQYVKAGPEEKAHQREMGLEVPGQKEQQVPLGSSETALEYLEIEAPVDQAFDLEVPRKEAAPPTREDRLELDAEAERLELPWN
ncbi:hypothetical protein CEP53_009945 [Fusarium sp. AF-6]|nr:hypothetical protein CEP53_009945 [Fusarium sp. AF-6]